MKEIKIGKVSSLDEIAACLQIRKKVFVEGQNVPLDREQDGKDEASDHYLLSVNSLPIAVARVRFEDGLAKIERVAVLDNFQGKGYGYKLMDAILNDLRENKCVKSIKLSAQSYSIAFYEKLGFKVASQEYLDAGIPHNDMIYVGKV